MGRLLGNVDLVTTFLLTLLYAVTQADDYRIITVVDVKSEAFVASLQTGVSYINSRGSGLLTGHTVVLDVVLSRDNDSFSAMDEVCTKIQDGASLILDLSSRYVTLTIRSLAEAMGITHVAAVDPSYYESDEREFETSVNFVPPSSTMLLSIRDIVKQENLTNVGIIYDQSFNLDDKPKRLLRNIPAQHLYLRMPTTSDGMRDQLDKLKSADLHHIFLASTDLNANNYLGRANEKGMMSFKYSWYVLTMDQLVVCDHCIKPSSVLSITATNYSSLASYRAFVETRLTAQQTYEMEMSAVFHYDIMKIIGLALHDEVNERFSEKTFVDCYKFIETDQTAKTQAVKLRETIQEVKTPGVFGKFEWTGKTAEQDLVLDIKRISFEGGAKNSSQLVGNWSKSSHLHAFEGSITNRDIKKTYRVITLKEPPFVFRSTVKPANVEKYYYNSTSGNYYYGYCIDLIYKINEEMDFEFTLMEPPDDAYGTMQSDGTWNGIVNEILQDRADIAVAPLSVMAERENVIDFTVPYYDLVGITILMKKPKFEYSVFKFMSVLEEAVWGCVFSAFIIVSVLLAVFDKYSPYSYQNNKKAWDGQGQEPRVFTLKEGLWFCMTSLTPQGGGEAPRALSGRLVAATWWMFGFIMIATYTANLAAFLTVSRLDQPIESLDDLAKQFKTKYAPQESTATETYFRRMADIEERFYSIWKAMSLNDSLDQVERAKLAVWDYPVSDKFTNMWAAMEDSKFPKNFEDAINRIKNPPSDNEDFAFIGDATQNKYAISTDCYLWEVGEEFSRKPYALAVQEGSPLKNKLSSVILNLLNKRDLEDLKTFWWDYDKKSCPKIEDESDGISIQNIGGVFLVIFIGIGLGLITLAFEYYWYKWRPAAKNRNNPQTIAVKSAHDNTGYTNAT